MEIIVSLSVLVFFLGLGITSYYQNQYKTALKSMTSEVRSIIELARSKSVNAEIPTTCTYNQFIGYGISRTGTGLNLVSLCRTGAATYVSTIERTLILSKYRQTQTLLFITFYFRKLTGDLVNGADVPTTGTLTVKQNLIDKCNQITISKFGQIKTDANYACP